MSGRVLRADWYRFTRTLRQRIGGYLALMLLLALVGGVALASIAGARRTESSFADEQRATNAADTGGVTAVLDPTRGSSAGYDPAIIDRIAHIPGVTAIASGAGVDISPLGSDGAPLPNFASAGNGTGSIDGFDIAMDRYIPLQGRLPDVARADEFFTDETDAQLLHLHVGSVVPFGIYTNAQTALPDFGTPKVQPYKRVSETLVGIGVGSRGVIQDDADAGVGLTSGLFTPALTRPLLNCCVNYTATGVQVAKGVDVAKVEVAANAILPHGFPPFADHAAIQAQAERTIRPDGIALGTFGAIAALAALVIAGLMIARAVQSGGEERAVLRALGAEPALTTTDGLIGVFGAIIVGAIGAVIVAIALSPLAPIGPFRRVLPHSIAVDWTALGFGCLALVVALAVVAVLVSRRDAPHRVAQHHASATSAAVRRATTGLPTSTAIGVNFAIDPGAGRSSVPVRSAIVGATLAAVVVVATLTFGASFRTLVTRPALYGWNWNNALVAGAGVGDIPQAAATKLVSNDHDIAASSPVYFTTLSIDGHQTPALGETPGAVVQPAVLSGHNLESAGDVVLGASTLAALHKRVGDIVFATAPDTPAKQLRIAGTVTLPAIGIGGESHLEMGSGAVVASQLIPPAQRNQFNDPIAGPNAILIRWASGTNTKRAIAKLQSIAQQLSNNANFGVQVVAVQRPAEIVNYRTMGSTPLLLGGALAFGAIVALLLTLLASVRRRRRDLALLKTLGFTRRQIASTVAWQSTIAVAIGLAVGIPSGVLLGRQLWILFARQIHAVPAPTVSLFTLVAVLGGGFALAIVVALFPARVAARTPAALLLHAD
jgi:hypothetical protein